MDHAVMERRLATARVGELATVTVDGEPHVVPVCFVSVGDDLATIVDRKPKTTTALRRLDNVRAHPRVSLLVHRYDEDWKQLWWVRVDGRARVVDEPRAIDDLVPHFLQKYPQYRSQPPTGPAIVLTPSRWVGWAASGSRA